MAKLKILSVMGTRPEAIKMAPVIKELQCYSEKVSPMICVTAQHRQMLDQVLDIFSIRSDYDLNIMEKDQSLAKVSTNVLTALESVVIKEQPDWVVVQGDTTTAMAASLAAFYHKAKVAHVEAGLRTWDKYRPFPEEINRKIIDTISDLHFVPTHSAKQNLLREGYREDSLVVTGNTVIDALLYIVDREYDFSAGPLRHVPMEKQIILVTVHRRENFGHPLKRIYSAILQIAKKYSSDVHIVYPVHLNPNVHEPAHAMLGGVHNISLIEPLDYLSFIQLMKSSYLILTDSGGIQEEAPSFGKPLLVLRTETERPEVVEAGIARKVGADIASIVKEATILLDDRKEYDRRAQIENPYGDGQASSRIVKELLTNGNVNF